MDALAFCLPCAFSRFSKDYSVIPGLLHMPELSRWHHFTHLFSKHQWPKANSFLAPETVTTSSVYCSIQSLWGRPVWFQRIWIYALWGQKLEQCDLFSSVFTHLKCSLEGSPVFLPLACGAQPVWGLMWGAPGEELAQAVWFVLGVVESTTISNKLGVCVPGCHCSCLSQTFIFQILNGDSHAI